MQTIAIIILLFILVFIIMVFWGLIGIGEWIVEKIDDCIERFINKGK